MSKWVAIFCTYGRGGCVAVLNYMLGGNFIKMYYILYCSKHTFLSINMRFSAPKRRKIAVFYLYLYISVLYNPSNTINTHMLSAAPRSILYKAELAV